MHRATFGLSRRRRLLASLLLSLGLTVWSPCIFGQTPPQRRAAAASSLERSLEGEAKASYAAAVRAHRDGDFAEAARRFERTYEQSADPRLLVRLADAENRLGHHVRVLELVERYQRESGTGAAASDLAEAKVLRESAQPFVSEASFSVQPEGATILVDDQPIGTSPLRDMVLVEQGTRRVRVSKPGFLDSVSNHDFQGASVTTVEVKLLPAVTDGHLRISASAGDFIVIDGVMRGKDRWEGSLPAGLHVLDVRGTGKRPHRSEIVVQTGQTQSLTILLDRDAPPGVREAPNRTWLWIAGGSVLAVAAGVGVYFLLQPGDREERPPSRGTLPPGSVPLSVRF